MYTPASATNHRLPYYSTRLSTLTLLSSIHCNYLSVCGLITILRLITSLCVKGKEYVQPRPHESIDQRSSFWKSLLSLRRLSCIQHGAAIICFTPQGKASTHQTRHRSMINSTAHLSFKMRPNCRASYLSYSLTGRTSAPKHTVQTLSWSWFGCSSTIRNHQGREATPPADVDPTTDTSFKA